MKNDQHIPASVRIARRLSWQRKIDTMRHGNMPRVKVWGGRPRPKRYGGNVENRGND